VKKILYFIPFVLVGAFIFWFINTLTVGGIICESQYGYCNDTTSHFLNTLEGKNYFKTKREINKYLKANCLVKESSLQYKFPNIIHARLVERKPLYALKTGENSFYQISGDGVVLGKTESSGLPFVENAAIDLPLGSYVNQDLSFSLKILRYLNLIFGINGGYLKETGVEFRIQDGPLVIFPKNGDSDILIGALRLIVQNVSQPNWEYSLVKPYNKITIDLRYRNPVIR